MFGVHLKCSYHGDGSMRVEGKESISEQCESMLDEKRANLKGGICHRPWYIGGNISRSISRFAKIALR